MSDTLSIQSDIQLTEDGNQQAARGGTPPAMQPAPRSIYLALPTYDGTYTTGALVGALNASDHHAVDCHPGGGSLLPKAFNIHWANAVMSGQYDYFAMLHADIWPESCWLDRLVAILELKEEWRKPDIVSAVVPLKDDRRLTSTGMWMFDRPEPHYRLSEEDKRQLPVTFGTDDVQEALGIRGELVVNTGCWIARLGRPWNRQVHFEFRDSIDWDHRGSGEPKVCVVSEDWLFSRKVVEAGGTVLATQAVALNHRGVSSWCARNLSGSG